MAEKILSIIIPMYQAERFIAKCLDSLLTDQRCLTYLEILIVNDGSRDRSGKIAAGYREKYPDSIRLIEKENGGHGSAVNAGVEQCSGKYFKVLDADDWVSPGGLKAVTEKLLVMEEADMVLAGFTIYDMNTKKVRHIRSRQKQGLRYLQMEELTADWDCYKGLLSLHGVIYRTDFYRMAGYRLPEGVYYDDAYFIASFAGFARRICVMKDCLYVYRVGCESQSTSNQNRQKCIRQMEHVLLSMIRIEDDLERRGADMLFWRFRVCSCLADYFVTVFLRFSDRKAGRRAGRRFYRTVRQKSRRLWKAVRSRYLILYMMGLLHMDECLFLKLLELRSLKNRKGICHVKRRED